MNTRGVVLTQESFCSRSRFVAGVVLFEETMYGELCVAGLKRVFFYGDVLSQEKFSGESFCKGTNTHKQRFFHSFLFCEFF